MRFALVAAVMLMSVLPAAAQTTGTINAMVMNKSGIAIVFNSDPSGVALAGTGTSAATMALGSVSAYGTLLPGVGRGAVGSTYDITSKFCTHVTAGGFTSYSMAVSLAAAAPQGIDYFVGSSTVLTTTSQTILTGQTDFGVDVSRTLILRIKTAAPGAGGGPATGTTISTTINFTVTGA